MDVAEAMDGEDRDCVPASRTARLPPFHMLVPVWSRAFCSFFAEMSLPSQLAPGNLPALPYPDDCLYHIITAPADRDYLEGHPSVACLREVLPVRIDCFAKHEATAHATMSACLRLGIARADDRDAASVFFNPDFIFADGSIATLARIAGQGARAVFGLAPRLRKETAEPVLAADRRDQVLAVPPRRLVTMSLEHMHPMSHQHLWEEGDEPLIPANLYWRTATGYLAHCYHLHPFLVHPRNKHATFTGTVDDDFVRYACRDAADRVVIDDSEGFFVAEVSRSEHHAMSLVPKGRVREVALWAKLNASDLHRELLGVPIRCHIADQNPTDWQPVEARASRVVAEIRNLTDRPTLLMGAPLTAIKQLARRAKEYDAETTNGLPRRGGALAAMAQTIAGLLSAYEQACQWYLPQHERLRAQIFGTDRAPKRWHPAWLTLHRDLVRALDRLPDGGERVLVLGSVAAAADRIRARWPDAKVVVPPQLDVLTAKLRAGEAGDALAGPFDLVVCHRLEADCWRPEMPEAGLLGVLVIGGRLVVIGPQEREGSILGRYDGDPGWQIEQASRLSGLGSRICGGLMSAIDRVAMRLRPTPVFLEIPLLVVLWPLEFVSYGLLTIVGPFIDRWRIRRPGIDEYLMSFHRRR